MRFHILVIILAVSLLGACKAPDPRVTGDLAGIPTESWVYMLDKEAHARWKPEGDFVEGGKPEFEDTVVTLTTGEPFSGAKWLGTFPKTDYEVRLEAKRTKGEDIMCGLLFPVGKDLLSFVMGGWGNTVIGCSSIDELNASENDTYYNMPLKNNIWYEVKLRITPKKIQAWIGKTQVINFEIDDHKISPYPGLEEYAPFGVFTWDSSSEIRNLRVMRLKK